MTKSGGIPSALDIGCGVIRRLAVLSIPRRVCLNKEFYIWLM
jgi:hypothetical protein